MSAPSLLDRVRGWLGWPASSSSSSLAPSALEADAPVAPVAVGPAARLLTTTWGTHASSSRYTPREDGERARAFVERLLTHTPRGLQTIDTNVPLTLDDLQRIVAHAPSAMPQLRRMHCCLPDEMIPLLQRVPIAARRSALRAALDDLGVIPDLAALCDEYAHSGVRDGWSLPVQFLPRGLTDVGLLVRDCDHFQPSCLSDIRFVNDFPLFPHLMTALFHTLLSQLPHLTALTIDVKSEASAEGVPADCLSGFDWSVIGDLTALRSLTLKTTQFDSDHGTWVAWDEPTAIAALRRLPHLTYLDVSGCRRPHTKDEWAAGWDHALRAFDIVSFARPPLAHASLTQLELSGGWHLGKWTAAECAAFRSLPQLRTIDRLSVEQFMQRNDAMETVGDEEPEEEE